MKILIVDDSRMDRRLLMSTLSKSGIENEILQAEDGEQGIQLLSENQADIGLVLLDWQMPKVDGIAFMKAVVQSPLPMDSIPIIMITASGSDENKKLAHDVNPNLAGYVVKPYKKEELIELINKHLK
ncbi:hypothetical protein MNBD_UNCLBAC01-2111 [hydrothermal vent metagenome]|uniref:Response regulatory domain-containing protein n=1 Tax=hydrothermal vent metagenome TaxID=652676 RepID=A0A3B1DGI9_9ZZZZ